MSLSRRPFSLLARPRAWAMASSLFVITGCGDSAQQQASLVPKIEIGAVYSANELHPLPNGGEAWTPETFEPPTYLAPYREPAPMPEPSIGPIEGGAGPLQPLASPKLYDEPTELLLTPPTTSDTSAEESWADAWADWPDESEASEPVAIEASAPAAEVPTPVAAKPMSRVEPIDLFPPPAAQTDAVETLPSIASPLVSSRDADLDFAEDLLTEVPAASEIGWLMVASIREGFSLGRSGAVFAARAKFEEALRRIATAKDAAVADDRHTRALAAGLRALDEAQHFQPQGDALDESLDVETIARSHRTAVLHEATYERTLPQEAIARYHLHAAKQLAVAVEGEQAGSMALFGLGKAYGRLAELADEPLSRRRSLAMYRAAILAHGGNYLAANELGVGLAQAGHYQAASRALDRAASRGGGSTVHRNLAMVQRRLARPQLAVAAEQRAEQLAAQERLAGAFSQQLGLQWVDAKAFARTGGETPRPAQTPTAVAQAPTTPKAAAQPTVAMSPRGPWRGAPPVTRQASKRPVAAIPGVGNQQAPPVKSQTIVR